MRLAFMGSPDFAVPTLAALIEAGHEIACVFSQPPKPAGRGQTLRATPVQAFAEARGLPTRTPKSLKKPAEQEAFAALDLDAAVVVAYGLILPRAILDAPRLGCFNLHGSLLPRWRGAAPMQRAIEAGDRETGVQVMGMEEGLDTGPVFATARVAIHPFDTAGSIHDKLAALGAPLMVEALAGIAAGTLRPTPQSEEGVTYAAKIEREETRVDWTWPAVRVDRTIRAFSPFPGAWCRLPDGRRAKLLLSRFEADRATGAAPGTLVDDGLAVACGDGGVVRLLELQREGRGPLPAADFLRGTPLPAGARLG
jgi:methionyl-tRNA formyltransferase